MQIKRAIAMSTLAAVVAAGSAFAAEPAKPTAPAQAAATQTPAQQTPTDQTKKTQKKKHATKESKEQKTN